MAKSNFNSDYGYYNVLINNDTEEIKNADFQETRQAPILSNMQDWQLAVVRFKIPAASIPLFVFEDTETPAGSGNYVSPYYVGFSIGQNYATPIINNVVYIPQFGTSTSNIRPYNRFMYYYTSFLQMINEALKTLFDMALLDAAYQPLLNAFTNVNSPFIELDDATSYMKLILPVGGTVNAPTTSPFVYNQNGQYINIHFSKKLFYFLAGFNAKLLQTPPLQYMDYVLMLSLPNLYDNITSLKPYNGINERPIISFYQDYSCLYLWNTLSRILLTTNIPVEQELIGVKGADGQNYSQTLLTDFEVPPNREGNQRDYIFYFADFPRYINFSSNGDLRQMDLRIYFQTRDLQTFQLQIPPTFEASVKLQFKRRKAKGLLQYSGEEGFKHSTIGYAQGAGRR